MALVYTTAFAFAIYGSLDELYQYIKGESQRPHTLPFDTNMNTGKKLAIPLLVLCAFAAAVDAECISK